MPGSFAIAFQDSMAESLTLYRPPSSVHALFWKRTPDGVAFASTPDALGGPIDVEAVACALVTDKYFGSRTHLRDVHQVEPGTAVTIERATVRVERDTWRVDDGLHSLTLSDAAVEVQRRLSAAVSTAIDDAVPVHVLFSGGLDSTAVAWEAAKMGGRPTAMSLEFATLPALGATYEHGAETARALGLNHIRADVSPLLAGSLLADPGALLWPTCDSFAPMEALVECAREQVKPGVLLSGYAADHLFETADNSAWRIMGPRLLNPFRSGRWPWQLPWPTLRLAHPLLHRGKATPPPIGLGCLFQPWLSEQFRDAALSAETADARVLAEQLPPDSAYAAIAVGAAVRSAQMVALTHRLSTHSFDLVSPYLDRALVELCLSLGPVHRTLHFQDRLVSKMALRAAYAGVIPHRVVVDKLNGPDSLVYQRFVRRHSSWLQGLFAGSSALGDLGVVDVDQLRGLLRTRDGDRLAHAYSLFRTASLECWFRARRGEAPWVQAERSERIRAPRSVPAGRVAVARIPVHVQRHECGEVSLLVNRLTRDLVELNDDALSVWQAVTTQATWAGVQSELRSAGYVAADVDAVVETFVAWAIDAGWLLCVSCPPSSELRAEAGGSALAAREISRPRELSNSRLSGPLGAGAVAGEEVKYGNPDPHGSFGRQDR